MKQKNGANAIFFANIAGLIAAIPLGFCWYFAQIMIYFSASETLGGPEIIADWAWQVSLAITICAISLDAFIIIKVYHYILKRRGSKTKEPLKKLLIIGLPLPILLIMAFYGYQYFLTIRSGSLNPYTQTCIKEGYKGAVGDSCIN